MGIVPKDRKPQDTSMHLACWATPFILSAFAGFMAYLATYTFEVSQWWSYPVAPVVFVLFGIKNYREDALHYANEHTTTTRCVAYAVSQMSNLLDESMRRMRYGVFPPLSVGMR